MTDEIEEDNVGSSNERSDQTSNFHSASDSSSAVRRPTMSAWENPVRTHPTPAECHSSSSDRENWMPHQYAVDRSMKKSAMLMWMMSVSGAFVNSWNRFVNMVGTGSRFEIVRNDPSHEPNSRAVHW